MLTAEFIKAINLANKNMGYDIVLRPHPTGYWLGKYL